MSPTMTGSIRSLRSITSIKSITLTVAAMLVMAAVVAGHPVARADGTIRGRVRVPVPPPAAGRPAVSDLSASPHVAVDRRRVVVYLETAPRQAFADVSTPRARIEQRGEQFIPRILAVTTGTVVDFPNNDRTFHDVFSLSRVRAFDLGRYPPGKTGSIRFDRPGIVPIFCDIHSHMSAYVLVFNHPFFAVSDADGRYEISGVPAGTYSVAVWSELGDTAPRRVTVQEGAATETDFEVIRQP
jgi:plastocyanin